MGSARGIVKPTLMFTENTEAQSSRPHKNPDTEIQTGEIPDSVLSQNIFG
jgi:hypothetical protein